MSLLRIHASLVEPPARCQWAVLARGAATIEGSGMLAQLPRGARRVALVLPAAQVLIACVRLPPTARRLSDSMLAFAVEDQFVGEPDANQVYWIGRDGDDDALAVIDRAGLQRWRIALAAVGIRDFELHSEALLLPWQPGEWSLAWSGSEGFLRSANLEAMATDVGDASTPPLVLRMALAQARLEGCAPSGLALYPEGTSATPDIAAWASELDLDIRVAERCDWRCAPIAAGIRLSQERQGWQPLLGMAKRLRVAAVLAGLALTAHAAGLLVDWHALANERQALRERMEARFRAAVPGAVAVVDPALQMQRLLAEARHAKGRADDGDFLSMVEPVAVALQAAPAGTLRRLTFNHGELTLVLAAVPIAHIGALQSRLQRAGLRVEASEVANVNDGEVLLKVRRS